MKLKQIPGTDGFLASEDGTIYAPDGSQRNTYRNGDGYVTASVKLLDGRWVTFGVHRLVALAFLEPPDVDYTEVNHREPDLNNNHRYNLEWVTPQENNIHSEIFRSDNQYPTICAFTTKGEGSTVLFKNVYEAEMVTGIPRGRIWEALRWDEWEYDPTDGCWKFAHQPWDGLVPDDLKKPTIVERDSKGRPPERAIKLMDVDTGDIEVYASMADVARQYGVGASHLYQSIPRHGKARLFKKQYQVAYADQDFLEISLEELEKAKSHGPRDTVAYCAADNFTVLASSAKELIELLKLSKKAVTTSLATRKIREISDGERSWVVTYFNGPESIKQLKAYYEGPAEE